MSLTFKETMIANAENAINAKRRRKAELQEELEQIETDEQEARAILQLLKTGKVPQNGRMQISKKEFEEAVRTLGEGGVAFSPTELADLLGMSIAAASGRLQKAGVSAGLIELVQKGGPGVSAYYKLRTES